MFVPHTATSASEENPDLSWRLRIFRCKLWKFFGCDWRASCIRGSHLWSRVTGICSHLPRISTMCDNARRPHDLRDKTGVRQM